LSNQPSCDLKIIENKSKEERTEKIADNNRHKKRKKKSKNNQQLFCKTDKVSDMNLQSTDFSKKYCDRVNHTVRKDNKKELKKTGKKKYKAQMKYL